MSKTLDLGSDFRIAIDILTSAIGIIGVRGSGKTSTAGVVVEEAIAAGVPCAITDPTGAWFGLKSSADGKSAGLPVYVFGGEHADVPLEPDSGKIVARFVVEKRVPVVLDVSLMTKGQRIHFVGEFHEEVYHRNRDPLLIVIDETAQFVPQQSRNQMTPQLGACIGAIDDIVSLGRRRGLGCILIGQRPARINKDVLTQVHTLIAMQITSPQDRKAVNEWVQEQHGSDEQAHEFLKSLTTLKVGEGFVWSPTMLGVFERVRFRNRHTFDSSATPKVGQKVIQPKAFAEIDLSALTSEIAAAKERAEADDPKRLRAKIRDLEEQLEQKPDAPPEVIEKYILQGRELEAARSFGDHMATLGEKMTREFNEALRPVLNEFQKASADVARQLSLLTSESATVRTIAREKITPVRTSPDRVGTSSNGATSTLTKAERLILTVLAQYPSGRTAVQIAILTGYAVNGGGFRNALGSLNSKGYIVRGNNITISDAGLKALGPFDLLPTGRALLDYWLGELNKAESLSLRAIAEAYPRRISVEAVAAAAGYESKGGGFRNALGKLRTLQLIEGRGELRASDALFERAPK
jgi:uncharacterized protein